MQASGGEGRTEVGVGTNCEACKGKHRPHTCKIVRRIARGRKRRSPLEAVENTLAKRFELLVHKMNTLYWRYHSKHPLPTTAFGGGTYPSSCAPEYRWSKGHLDHLNCGPPQLGEGRDTVSPAWPACLRTPEPLTRLLQTSSVSIPEDYYCSY